MTPETFQSKNPLKNFYTLEHGYSFPARAYIVEVTGKIPSLLCLPGKYKPEAIDFLLANSQLVSSERKPKEDTYWFHYKDCFICAESSVENSQTLYKIEIAFGTGTPTPEKELEKFIYKQPHSTISLFIKTPYDEYDFEPLALNDFKAQTSEQLTLNYGSKFTTVHRTIAERLTSKKSGLYMFHGPPGTGKSSYLKHLASTIKREFIYVPTPMLEVFVTEPACLQRLTTKPNSVLVLEDAEKILFKRAGDTLDSTALSSMLNITDGILSDILNIAAIVTYNCDISNIDTALKRKGRLIAQYEFGPLQVPEARELAAKLGYPPEQVANISEPATLAEIYNLNESINLSPVQATKTVGFSP